MTAAAAVTKTKSMTHDGGMPAAAGRGDGGGGEGSGARHAAARERSTVWFVGCQFREKFCLDFSGAAVVSSLLLKVGTNKWVHRVVHLEVRPRRPATL